MPPKMRTNASQKSKPKRKPIAPKTHTNGNQMQTSGTKDATH